MGQVVKINFSNIKKHENTIHEHKNYVEKLIKIRDDIEEYLFQVSFKEGDELAVALAAGRYATMKLAQLTGENETKKFVNDCIKTTLKN